MTTSREISTAMEIGPLMASVTASIRATFDTGVMSP
jgi:hypothetical protein